MFPGFDAMPEVLRPLAPEPRELLEQPVIQPPRQALVDCAVYSEGARLPGESSYAAALAQAREIQLLGPERPAAFVWVGLHEPDTTEMRQVADVFGLHPLAVEHAVSAYQRPKVERYDDTVFLVLKTVSYVPHESVTADRKIVETGEIMVFVGKDFVITVRHGEHGGLSDVRKRLETDPEHLRLGPYSVLHAIADDVVDRYLEVSLLIEADVDSIEETAFAPGGTLDVEPIYLLKREVVELRRCVSPLAGAFQRLQTDNKDLISREVRRYLRDVADHQAEAADQIGTYNEMLNSLVHAALARVGMQQNNDMRRISAWAGMLAVPTAIAGIYGMNFDNMPELHWAFAYPAVLGTMATICLLLYRTFRRNNWL